MSYHYELIPLNKADFKSYLESHAVFGALFGDGLIERFDVYRRAYDDNVSDHDDNGDDEDTFGKEHPRHQQQKTRGNLQNASALQKQSRQIAPPPPKRQHQHMEELAAVNLQIGTKLNGHGGIVHGGIIALLFDEAMGWARGLLWARLRAEQKEVEIRQQTVAVRGQIRQMDEMQRLHRLERSDGSGKNKRNGNIDNNIAINAAFNGNFGNRTSTFDKSYLSPTTLVVTANLNVNYRTPLSESSEAVLRVYHDGLEGRKIHFSAVLENRDGRIVYAEATSLFIPVPSKL
jgi:acyl-coenzyme A thioesterase PaaI-like protein